MYRAVLIGLCTLNLCSTQTSILTSGVCMTQMSVDGIEGDVLHDLCKITPYRNLVLVFTCKDQGRLNCLQPGEPVNVDVCNGQGSIVPNVPISMSRGGRDHRDSDMSMNVSLVVHDGGDVEEVDFFQLHSNLQSHAPVTRIELIGSYKKTRIQIALHRTCWDSTMKHLHRTRRDNKLGQSVRISKSDSETESPEKHNTKTVKISIPDSQATSVKISIPDSQATSVKISIPDSQAMLSGKEDMVFSGEGEQTPTSLDDLVKESLHRLKEQMTDISQTSSRIAGHTRHSFTELPITFTAGSNNGVTDNSNRIVTEPTGLTVTSDIPESSMDSEMKDYDRPVILTTPTPTPTALPPVSANLDITSTTSRDPIPYHVTGSLSQRSSIVYVPTKTLHKSSRYATEPTLTDQTTRYVTISRTPDSTSPRVKLPQVGSQKNDTDLSKLKSQLAIDNVLSKEILGESFVAEANKDVPRVVDEINDQEFLSKLMDSLRNRNNEKTGMALPTPLAFSKPKIPTTAPTSQSSSTFASSTLFVSPTTSVSLTSSTSSPSRTVISSVRPVMGEIVPETFPTSESTTSLTPVISSVQPVMGKIVPETFPTSESTTSLTPVKSSVRPVMGKIVPETFPTSESTTSLTPVTLAPVVGVPTGKAKSNMSTITPAEHPGQRSTLPLNVATDPPIIIPTVSGSKRTQSLQTLTGNAGDVTMKAVTHESSTTENPLTTGSASTTSAKSDDDVTTDSQLKVPADEKHADNSTKPSPTSESSQETRRTTTPLSTVFPSSTASAVSSAPTKDTLATVMGSISPNGSKRPSTALSTSLNTNSSETANTTITVAPTIPQGMSNTTTSSMMTTVEIEHLPGQTPGPLLATSSESKTGRMSVSGDPGNDDTFWPIVAALVIGIPSVIVFGIAITVIHKRRLGHPTRSVESSMYPSL